MPDTNPPNIDFSGFVASFAATGVMALQQVEEALAPSTPEAPEQSPELAANGLMTVQHLIATLTMLETKTSGNLTTEEQQALERALTDLKFGYVRAKGRVQGSHD